MSVISYPFDGQELMKRRRSIKRKLKEDGTARLPKKIAVLGGSTTHDIIEMMDLFLLDQGIEAEFYESEYNRFFQDAMFGNEELDSFHPDIIFIHTSLRNITVPFPRMTDSAEEIEARLEEQYGLFEAIWENISAKYQCPVIQNNFELPAWRLLGNRDAYDIHGRTHFVQALNQKFYEYASTHPGFYIHDIQFLSASYGLEQWSQPQYWYMYKYALCIDAIPEFAFNLVNIIKSIFGKNKKVLALDLDNTLWGGVVGDDGVEGIAIGHENAQAEAYTEFQSYIKAHKDLGVLLTVCSKNEEENALAGLNHPDTTLRPDDFTMITANWENKDRNIMNQAQMLDLLPESLVFVDDNPAERTIVEQNVPGIAAPEMEGVENYISILDRNGYFEVTSFSKEDLKRTELYKENMKRAVQKAAFSDYGEYLDSLEMTAYIRDFDKVAMQRITQLTNKSNQFNVTTKRYTLEEMEQTAADPDSIRLYGRLIDKFGDNGIVSVVIGEKDGEALNIVLWLMSCRVLKRDMELAMLDELAAKASEAGLKKLKGWYYPTAKNNMVRGLYESFGFSKVEEKEDGSALWELDLAGYQNKNTHINVTREVFE